MVRPVRRASLAAGLFVVALAAGCASGDTAEPPDAPAAESAGESPLASNAERMVAAIGSVCGVAPEGLVERPELGVMDDVAVMASYETPDGTLLGILHLYRATEIEAPRPWLITCGEAAGRWLTLDELNEVADAALAAPPAEQPDVAEDVPLEPPPAVTGPDDTGDVNCPPVPAERVSGEQAAVCLYRAWQQRDRELAEVYGSPGAVETLWAMEWDGTTEWTFHGCDEGDGVAAVCSWDAADGDAGHGVWVEMLLGGSPSAGNVVEQVDFYG